MTTTALRCRAAVHGSSLVHLRQCPHPAKGERAMELEGAVQVLPACGRHLARRYTVTGYVRWSERYQLPVTTHVARRR